MVNISIDNGMLQCFFITFSVHNPPVVFGLGILVIIINIITAPMAIVGNMLIIIAIIRTPSLQTPSNFLISNLAIGDLLTGLLCQPMFVVYKIAELEMDVFTTCMARTVIDTIAYIASGMSFVTLCLIAIERYLALHFHLRYQQLVSIKRLTGPVVGMWSVFTALSVTRFFTENQTIFAISMAAIFTTILSVTFWAYSKIYQIVKRHRLQIQSQQRLSILTTDSEERNGSERLSSMNQFQMARYRKSTYTMVLVLGLFVITYGPFLTVQTVLSSSFVGYNIAVKIAMLITVPIIFITATMNPLLFCLRIKALRRACVRLIPLARNDADRHDFKTETARTAFHARRSAWQ